MPKILIVEANAETRDTLTRGLERGGFQVVVAADGKVGVGAAGAEKPDLILMNLNMPELDGWEATRQIRAAPETAHIPVIAVTSHPVPGDRERALAAGCVDYHTQPVELPGLLTRIEALLIPGGGPPSSVPDPEPQRVGQKDPRE
jgi:CheY-like chemotaxis protein